MIEIKVDKDACVGCGLCVKDWSMDKGVGNVARKVISDGIISDSDKNQIDMVIRAYDPCISCATHAIGKMPFKFTIVPKRKGFNSKKPKTGYGVGDA